MKTQITPWGVVLEIEHEGKTYHGIIQNDFTFFATFGNYNLDIGSLILFDEEFNKLSFSEKDTRETLDLYNIIEDLIEKIVVNQEDDEDEDDEDEDHGERDDRIRESYQ